MKNSAKTPARVRCNGSSSTTRREELWNTTMSANAWRDFCTRGQVFGGVHSSHHQKAKTALPRRSPCEALLTLPTSNFRGAMPWTMELATSPLQKVAIRCEGSLKRRWSACRFGKNGFVSSTSFNHSPSKTSAGRPNQGTRTSHRFKLQQHDLTLRGLFHF